VLLREYFDIRKRVYTETFNIADFSTHDDKYDDPQYTDFLIVQAGEKVVGGSRLTYHYKDTDMRLPMEDDNFILEDIFPSMSLRDKTYTEITRIAVLPDYRIGREVGKKMIELQLVQSVQKGAEYMFAVTPLVQVRNKRIHFQQLGYKMKTCNDVVVPDKPAYDGKKMYLAMADIHNKFPVGYEKNQHDHNAASANRA
jgi:N-acyl-L-homoserine lactone synthetase